jgi:orotate phosphoribosyltransferase
MDCRRKIEGLPKKPLIVVDDVVTTGQSVIDAVNALIEDDNQRKAKI